MNKINHLSAYARDSLYCIYKNGIQNKTELTEYFDISIDEYLIELQEANCIYLNDDEIFVTDNSLYTVGLSILSDYTYINVCSYKKIIKERRIETELIGKGEIFLENITSVILDMTCGLEDKVVGLGILIVGSVNEQQGISKNSYGILNPNCDIAQTLEFSTGYPAVLGHNVRAVCSCLVTRDRQNFIYLKHSPGIGASFCVDGNVISGSHGEFGEIGHIPFSDSQEMCRCGKKGCLETEVSDNSIINNYKELTGHTCQNVKSIYDSYMVDKNAKIVLDNVIEKIVRAIDHMYMLFDPEIIILNGGIFDYPIFLDKIKEKLNKIYGKMKCEIITLECIEEIKAIAPAILSLDSFLLNRR